MRTLSIIAMLSIVFSTMAQRTETTLRQWQFAHEVTPQQKPDQGWKDVQVPHDWAISLPFDRQHDLQVVAVVQNGEKIATEKTGRSGGLPWMGSAWYQTTVNLQPNKDQIYTLYFDGAMADPHVYVNGQAAGYWHYGYNAFCLDITPYLQQGDNQIAVRLENLPLSSRWYPGAGLFRPVQLIATHRTHIPVWGTYITTPYVTAEQATVRQITQIEGADRPLRVRTTIENDEKIITCVDKNYTIRNGQIQQNFLIEKPKLWSPETPNLYIARTQVYDGEQLLDEYTHSFGIRKIEYAAGIGFLLNGQVTKFKGVCNHHDLGPLGSAVSRDALRHQLTMLKDMGCNAIRTSHNMPAQMLVELCDEMGLMMMVEPFDEWRWAKCENGYHRFFDQPVEADAGYKHTDITWSEADMINMLHHFRNHPSVVMWSIGNEVWEQCLEGGVDVARYLQDICHREDPTRPVTCGADQLGCILDNGFAEVLDIPGFNYRTHRYVEAHERLPQEIVLGSETASTVSSRGSYKVPAEIRPDALYADHQSSGYDLEYCSWSGLPDQDFQLADDYAWEIGQFVWTGFDYLGEPSPYDTDMWPSHSSVFGIIDLASLPKDRYYLYRSQWNKQSPTLHIVAPLNTIEQKTKQRPSAPVMVYTTFAAAELFVDGQSMGKRIFGEKNDTIPVGDFELASWGSAPRPDLLPRYRLIWGNVPADAKEYKVIAYNNEGKVVMTQRAIRAGKPHHLQVEWANRNEKTEEGLCYLTVSVVDKDGNLCYNAEDLITLKTQGDCQFVATANGNPACLDSFVQPRMHAFVGQCTFIVRGNPYMAQFSAKGLKAGSIK